METVEVLEGLEREVHFAVSGAELNKRASLRLAQLARSATMPGFRPGKVPMKMIESMHGRATRLEVLSELVSKSFEQVLNAQNIRIAGEPAIEPVGDVFGSFDVPEFRFKARFEVYPEFQIEGIEELEIEELEVSLTEADVDRTIDVLRRQRADWQTSDAPSARGDRLVIDFEGRLDGEAFEHGSAEGYVVELGVAALVEDFEQGLYGRRAGETFVLPVRFPESYPAPRLAGKTASFQIVVHAVSTPMLPALDADFVSALGIGDGDLDTLRANVRRNLEREVKRRVNDRAKLQVMDRLTRLARFEVPRTLVEAEAQDLMERAREDLRERGQRTDTIAWKLENFVPAARERVQLALIVTKLVTENKLQSRPEQLRPILEEMASAYENPSELIRHTLSDRDRMADLEKLALEKNLVDFVLARARRIPRSLSLNDLMPQAALS